MSLALSLQSCFSTSGLPSFKNKVFQLYKVVFALPPAFCLEGFWAGLTLAMVIEYKASHRKRVVFQEHCYENKEIELQVHIRAVAALSLSFFLLSLIMVGKCLSCPLGFFVTICLTPVILFIAIPMYCKKVLDKFSYSMKLHAVKSIAFSLSFPYLFSSFPLQQ